MRLTQFRQRTSDRGSQASTSPASGLHKPFGVLLNHGATMCGERAPVLDSPPRGVADDGVAGSIYRFAIHVHTLNDTN